MIAVNKIWNNCIKVVQFAWSEWKAWIWNTKMLMIPVFWVFLYNYLVQPLAERATKYGGKMSLPEPFVGMCNSRLLMLILPAIFLVLMSDRPCMSGNVLYTMKRTGRIEWTIGQMLFSIMAVLSFFGLNIVVLFVMCRGEWNFAWSDVVTKYLARYPEELNSFASELLPSSVYNQFHLPEAFIHSGLLQISYWIVLVYILIFFTIIGKKRIGFIIDILLITGGYASMSMGYEIRWLFPMAQSMLAYRFNDVLRKPYMPIYVSYLYFFLLILVLIVASLLAIRRVNIWGDEP